ncbi:MAG: hypothetical protein R3C49_17200 [Planctomycetaceae bacterium]
MKTLFRTTLLAVVGVSVWVGQQQLFAQSTFADPAPSVAYRLKDAKTLHFQDTAKAQLHLETVKKLGCEGQLDSHGDHTDVVYRLATWKVLTLNSETTAHQWEDWMKRAGFETLHAHAEGQDHAGHNHGAGNDSHAGHQHGLADGHFVGDGHDHGSPVTEVVSYNAPDWIRTQPRSRQEADEMTAILKGMGCDVRTGESEIAFRCFQPMHLEFPSHQVAAGWQDWMTRTGFQTQHRH